MQGFLSAFVDALPTGWYDGWSGDEGDLRALSPDEVKENYEATRSLFHPAAATQADG